MFVKTKKKVMVMSLKDKIKNYTLPISFRLPIDIIEEITTAAKDDGISRSQYMGMLLVKGLKADADREQAKKEMENIENSYKEKIGRFIRKISSDNSEAKRYLEIFKSL